MVPHAKSPGVSTRMGRRESDRWRLTTACARHRAARRHTAVICHGADRRGLDSLWRVRRRGRHQSPEHPLPDVIVTEIAGPKLDGLRSALASVDCQPEHPDIFGDCGHKRPAFRPGYGRPGLRRSSRSRSSLTLCSKPSDMSLWRLHLTDGCGDSCGGLCLRCGIARRSPKIKRRYGCSERIRGLIDRLQIAVLAFDDRGRYVATSPAVSSLTGYSRAQSLHARFFRPR